MYEKKIYKLEAIKGDPRYEGFGCGQPYPEEFPRSRQSRDWKVIRLAAKWKSLIVKGRVREFNDYPTVVGRPAFSQKAADALREFLEPNGELLPLISPVGTYFAYNVTTVADVLDWERSNITWNKKPITAIIVDRYEFFSDKLDGLSIFRIPEKPSSVYVTEAFVNRAEEHGLKGFDFRIVWPLPVGVKWKHLAAAQFHKRASEGLPKGQRIQGNTVVIRFLLSGNEATTGERLRVGQVMDELDALLVNPSSQEPAIGNLEGSDFVAEGEGRLFLSCPDADGLVNELREWFKTLDWPKGFSIIKRYGEFMDKNARSEVVTL